MAHRVDQFQNGSCQGDELEESNVFKRKGVKYSVKACKYSCLAVTQKDRCNCTEYWLPRITKACNMSDDDVNNCLKDVTKEYLDGILECLNCPKPCRETKYQYSISLAEYPAMRAAGKSQDERRTKRNDILKVNIFYDDLDVQVIQEEEYYFLENLLGDIGGQLGLFSGISVITIVEFTVVFLYLITNFFNNRRLRALRTAPQAIDVQPTEQPHPTWRERQDLEKSKFSLYEGSPIPFPNCNSSQDSLERIYYHN